MGNRATGGIHVVVEGVSSLGSGNVSGFQKLSPNLLGSRSNDDFSSKIHAE